MNLISLKKDIFKSTTALFSGASEILNQHYREL